jgi:hypothetical protein
VKVADAIKTSSRYIRKRRVVVALLLAIAAFALFVWRLHSSTSPLAATANSEVQSKVSPPTLLKDDTANKQVQGNDKTASVTGLTSRAAVKPVEEESFLASIFKDFKNQTPEVCGLSAAEAKAFIASNGMSFNPMTNRTLTDATSRLIQSDNVREKAMGLYLFAQQAGWDAAASEQLNYPGCESSDNCVGKPYEAMQKAARVNAEPLVKLALDSSDISVYATALYACAGSNTGACGTISYARWAEMEPDNAAAWMMAASEAETRKDSAARTAALQRAVSADGYNTRLPILTGVLVSEQIQDQPPMLLASTLSMIVGLNAAYSIPSFAGIGRHCGRLETMDESRRVACDALATKMAEKDETLMGLMMAKAIGERSGWSAERLQPLKDEYEVFAGHAFEGMFGEKMFSCEAVSIGNQKLLRMLSLGERGTTSELVKKSGKTLAELAADYRKSAATVTK